MKASPLEIQLLDEIALKAGTDKASHHHNYTEIYASYFHSIRNLPLKFLEIGLWKGQSAKTWEEYFPQAELHFLDLHLDQVEYKSPRCHYHQGNQENPRDLEKLVQEIGSGFDIVIDDGGHTMSQQITSFTYLFPHIKPGGLYFIEDLHTSYWLRKKGEPTAVDFLKGLIDEVNFVGAISRRASHQKIAPDLQAMLSHFEENIYSICFYDSLAVIAKRAV
ncbi:MAG: hypothetical protein JSS32_07435 [Verrucomicrobia bacterium]|nr:hypothetical protein [Verrucomicrobiota bacterium]